ncbi:bacterial alpha-L-rhamnosidase-domain-containing protein [Bisporella sp. PMI_857]|nr:bacterial alpha-L-rhamnosidase-domain-containing protein [Bisporella sp. PMI_857]
MKFLRCGIHGFHETLGIDVDDIHFYWVLSSKEEGSRQSACQVTLSVNSSIVWDSGIVQSEQQRNILCKPEDGLKSTTYYTWIVKVWDANGRASSSQPNEFFTALIFKTWFEDEANRWKGVWIGNGSDRPFYLRNKLSLAKKPSKAIMFASGLGHFNFRVNGNAASDHFLDPGWTNSHRTVQFVVYDLTSHLREGENALAAHVGNGFYAGDQGDQLFWPIEHIVHISDPANWQVSKSATTLANIYASETHDARLYPWGWDKPGFDDSHWSPAKALTGPRGKLSYQSQPAVTRQNTFVPKKTSRPRPGVLCFDLGQNSSIMVKIVVEGKAGSEITVRYAESIHDDGTVRMPDPLFKQFETHVYSTIFLAGRGKEQWSPEFCFTSATWGCATCFLPDILLKYYDSIHVVKKVYKPAVAYMEYMRTKERKGGLIEHGLGDWGRDIAFGNHQANIGTAVYYKCLKNVETMAIIQGFSEDAKRFSEWAQRIHGVYNQHLLVQESGGAYYTSLDNFPEQDCTAVCQAVALQFGLVPKDLILPVQKSFLHQVSDGRIRAGEIGLKYLFNTLDDIQRPDLVLQMARQEDHPSYMRFLRRGEATLLEFWQDECRSKCHDMLSTIYEWFYTVVLGIKPIGNAYRTFTITPPYTAEFDHIEGSVDCPYGAIGIVFDRRDNLSL